MTSTVPMLKGPKLRAPILLHSSSTVTGTLSFCQTFPFYFLQENVNIFDMF